MAPVSELEAARRQQRLRQLDLAELAGVSRTLVGLAERGYVPAGPTRARIATALGVDQRVLWPDEPEHLEDERRLSKAGAVQESGGQPRHAEAEG
jgi:transcriptional regulator with XRE-family HTH domain